MRAQHTPRPWDFGPNYALATMDGGRTTSEELEVTPEMIKAGVLALLNYDPAFSNERDVVSSIFLRMLAAYVYAKVMLPSGETRQTVACMIKNWKDASLIAAAPELLAALEFIVSQASEPANATHTLGAWTHGAGMKMARAAIAKAKGGAT